MSECGSNHRDVFVLSGGAARGAVQVGMVQSLLEAGIRPDGFVGTSVGALNAVFVARDPSVDRAHLLGERWCGLTSRDVFPGSHWTRIGQLARHPSALYSSDGLARLIERWAPVGLLERLPVPVRVVTTHLGSGRATYHDRGELLRLLLASAAIPAIFEPVRLLDPATGETALHVDGGIADLVPVAGAAALAPTRVWVLDASVPARAPRPRTPIDVLVASLSVAMRARPLPDLGPDVEVLHLSAPDLGTRMHDFSRSREHVALGRSAADEVLLHRVAA